MEHMVKTSIPDEKGQCAKRIRTVLMNDLLMQEGTLKMSDRERKIFWFAAYTKTNQELTIKKRLDGLEIENYLAMREEVRETSAGKKRVRVILIPHLIFIRTDQVTAFSLINEQGVNVVYLKDPVTRHSLIVPDRQMNDFMFLLDFSESTVEVINEELKRGDRVRVIKGPLAGLEGELLRIKGHKRVIVRLEGVVSIATSYIPGAFLEKIG